MTTQSTTTAPVFAATPSNEEQEFAVEIGVESEGSESWWNQEAVGTVYRVEFAKNADGATIVVNVPASREEVAIVLAWIAANASQFQTDADEAAEESTEDDRRDADSYRAETYFSSFR